ncbi:DUF2589 domain-containing protein [Psychroserpens mesophilus]|uniref:DUF2589 domain-containing protein n=1 Tax=Psychroserpens mesophilus TaxID=325473 RepID=UPI003F49824A
MENDFDTIEKMSNPNNDNFGISDVFTLGRIIQIPVDAVINANIDASKAAFNFIKTFGFEDEKDPNDPNKLGKPKMLTFSYKYNNAGIEQKMVVNIPVLSLVTMPFLNISKAKFDIGINILNKVTKSSSKPETLVLLGPTEDGKGYKKNRESNNESPYSNEFSTNMQASIEVESTDLPSGILQMINLFKDATNGTNEDIYALSTVEDKVEFSLDPKHKNISIEVTFTKNKKPVKNGLVIANVVSDTDSDLHDSFSKPIKVINNFGSQVGNASLGQAKALTNEDGKVKFKFSTHKMKVLNTIHNGFIYFNTPKASKIAVYYSINPKKLKKIKKSNS